MNGCKKDSKKLQKFFIPTNYQTMIDTERKKNLLGTHLS